VVHGSSEEEKTEIKELSEVEELKGKLTKQSEENKLMHSVLENDEETIDDGKTIKDASFEGEGCAISQASLSLITDKVKGMTKEEICAITEENMLAMLGIPISHARMKCALLGWNTLKSMMNEL